MTMTFWACIFRKNVKIWNGQWDLCVWVGANMESPNVYTHTCWNECIVENIWADLERHFINFVKLCRWPSKQNKIWLEPRISFQMLDNDCQIYISSLELHVVKLPGQSYLSSKYDYLRAWPGDPCRSWYLIILEDFWSIYYLVYCLLVNVWNLISLIELLCVFDHKSFCDSLWKEKELSCPWNLRLDKHMLQLGKNNVYFLIMKSCGTPCLAIGGIVERYHKNVNLCQSVVRRSCFMAINTIVQTVNQILCELKCYAQKEPNRSQWLRDGRVVHLYGGNAALMSRTSVVFGASGWMPRQGSPVLFSSYYYRPHP